MIAFFESHDLTSEEYLNNIIENHIMLEDVLKLGNDDEKYYEEALHCQPNGTPSRMEIYEKNPLLANSDTGEITDEFSRTLTTKQDRHPNSGLIVMDTDNGKAPYRHLTPRECFMLMGFEENDYETLIRNNFNANSARLFFPETSSIR